MTEKQKSVIESIFERRSVRQFIENKQVEKDKIIKLLETAMAAPSACNLQPWEFIVVSDKEELSQLITLTFNGKYNPPLAMIICANTKNIPWEGNGWMIDCSAAVENMLIAATAMGLGSVWIGAYHEEELRKLFNIPQNIKIMNIVYFGYPAADENLPSGTRYTEDAVFWGKYDPNRNRAMRTIEMLGDFSVSEPSQW